MIKQIYEQVREQIESDAAQLAPGEYLPSEIQYASMLNVSRITVRKAVDELVRAKMIRRVAGKGLMVAEEHDTACQGRLLISCPFVVGDNDYFKTVMGCIEAANALHYDYKIQSFTAAPMRLELMLQENLSHYSGAVVSCFESKEDRQTIRLLQEAGLPVVVVGTVVDEAPFIGMDDYNGGYIVGEYLIQQGHRDILYLTSDRDVSVVHDKERGFRQALFDNGIPIRDEYILSVKDPGNPIPTNLSYQRPLPDGIECYLDGTIPYTALTGWSTLPILSLCYRLIQRGIRVPDDVSVIAYGDQPFLPWQALPLTGVLEPKQEMGRLAVEELHRLLTGQIDHIESRLLPIKFNKQKSVRSLKPKHSSLNP